MKIHILQHEIFETPGVITNWIQVKNYKSTFTKFYENWTLPDLSEFDWLIIMGGTMGTYEEDKYPWLKDEKNFIKEAIDNDKTVLGICLGSQLIASALEANVYKNKYKEIGWFDVNLENYSNGNFLSSLFPKTIKVCQWHGDTFDLPVGAVRIASSEACENQAFIFNGHVIGLQFHMEFTEDTIKALIKKEREDLVKDRFIQTGEEILNNIDLLKSNNKMMFELLDRIEMMLKKTAESSI